MVSLTGIEAGTDILCGDSPQVTATVACGGSAKEIQVVSSTLCGYTGQLIVESEEILCRRRNIVAEWRDWERSPITQRPRPHMRIRLRRRNSDLLEPLTKANRDSLVVACGTLNEQKNKAIDQEQVESSNSFSSGDSRRNSLIWTSESEETLPEILELKVRLRSKDPKYADQAGVAHLVVFGHEDDQDVHVMDLPVKSSPQLNGYQASNDSRPPAMVLGPSTRLRVIIRSFPLDESRLSYQRDEAAPNLASLSSDSSASPTVLSFSKAELERNIRPTIDDFRSNVDNAFKLRNAGIPAQGENVDSSVMCGSLWSLQNLLLTIRHAITRCDDGADFGVQKSDLSVDSTIVTRESMML